MTWPIPGDLPPNPRGRRYEITAMDYCEEREAWIIQLLDLTADHGNGILVTREFSPMEARRLYPGALVEFS